MSHRVVEMAEIKTEPVTDYYDVKEELGRGRFAVVKRCIRISTGEVFAAKCIRKARAGRRGREQLLLEIDILHTSSHPKLVKLYDVFETRSEMILILEYAAGGDLHKHCLEVESCRTEKEICFLIYQIVQAATYLHDNHVVHLDLKPENILLKNDEKFPEIRLIDFGLSRRVDLPYSQYDIVGTPEYVAPEVLSYEAIQISADLWSIGVVSYVLLSGISPFAGDDVMETYANIANVDFDFDAEEFDDISDEAKDFIESLLIKDPKERLTTRECLEHPWLKQMSEGVKKQDIEAALIAEEAFEKLIREESISRLESEGDSVFSSDVNDEQAISSDESSDITAEGAADPNVDANVFSDEPVISEKLDESTQLSSKIELEDISNIVEDIAHETNPNSANECELGVNDSNCSISYKKEEIESSNKPSTNTSKTAEPKLSFGFDIDSLICKEEKSTKDTPVQKEVNSDISTPPPLEREAAHVQEEGDKIEVNGKEIVNEDPVCNEDVNGNEKLATVINGNLVAVDQNKCIKDVDIDLSKVQKSEKARDPNVHKRQKSSEAELCSRTNSLVTKTDSDKSDGKVTLMKTKSVDDTLLFGKKKTYEVGKSGKLGAHLEKLTKAGLNLVGSSEASRPNQSPNLNKNGTTELVVSAEQSLPVGKNGSGGNAAKKGFLIGSRSSGSSSSSGRVTPEVASLGAKNEEFVKMVDNDIPSKINKSDEPNKTPSKVLAPSDGKGSVLYENSSTKSTTPLVALQAKSKDENSAGVRSKPSTPSEEKSAYPKKTSLGVRQGIAAQMASKFTSSAEKLKTPPTNRGNKTPSQSLLSNRKYWENTSADSKESESTPGKYTPQGTAKIDKALFSNAVKVAKGEACQQQTAELERISRSPRHSPKVGRSVNVSDLQVKDRAEQYMKAASEIDGKRKGQVSSPQVEGHQSKAAARVDAEIPNLIRVGSKENIIQKFEKGGKKEESSAINQVHVQPRGLQFNFNLQAGNRFKQKDASVDKAVGNINLSRRDAKGSQEGKKTVKFDTKSELRNERKLELVTVPKTFSGMLEEGGTVATQNNGLGDDAEHIEHTAIGAIATMPRTPLRDLRSRSRTSRDGSPLSPRKAYRRLYVTHVKGSKSEQEAEASEEIAELKTKMEKDELKVELLVKFGTL